jgi:hypothetical protein
MQEHKGLILNCVIHILGEGMPTRGGEKGRGEKSMRMEIMEWKSSGNLSPS